MGGNISLAASNSLDVTLDELEKLLSSLIDTGSSSPSVSQCLQALSEVKTELANNLYEMGVSSASKTEVQNTLVDKVLKIKQSNGGEDSTCDYIISYLEGKIAEEIKGTTQTVAFDCPSDVEELQDFFDVSTLLCYQDFTDFSGQLGWCKSIATPTQIYLKNMYNSKIGASKETGLVLQGDSNSWGKINTNFDIDNNDFTLYFCYKSTGACTEDPNSILSIGNYKIPTFLSSFGGDITLKKNFTRMSQSTSDTTSIRSHISERQWNIICIAHDKNSKKLYFYINGELIGIYYEGEYSIDTAIYFGTAPQENKDGYISYFYSTVPYYAKMFALYNNFQSDTTVAKNSKALADYYITETFTYPLSPQKYETEDRTLYWDAEFTGKGKETDNESGTSLNLLQDAMGNIIGRIDNSSSSAWGDNYLTFNGTNSMPYCLLLHSYMPNPKADTDENTKITLEATLEINGFTGYEQEIITNYNSGGFGIGVKSSTNELMVQFCTRNNSWTKCQMDSSKEATQLNKIYHVVGTYDGSQITLWVNGEKKNTVTATGYVYRPAYNTVLGFGQDLTGFSVTSTNRPGSSQYFNGKLYNARIYNSVLTDEQIANNWAIEDERYGISTQVVSEVVAASEDETDESAIMTMSLEDDEDNLEEQIMATVLEEDDDEDNLILSATSSFVEGEE